MISDARLNRFLEQHQLPASFLTTARAHFLPLAKALSQLHEEKKQPLLIGINGCQGSGKSTLASLLSYCFEQQHKTSLAISLDDFYLSRKNRKQLAESVHPLLVTRGVPGTHDVVLMKQTLEKLLHGHGTVAVPHFDKASDEPWPVPQQLQQTAPVDMLVFEGWCLGTPAQSETELAKPVNELEATQDPDAIWRHYVNRQIIEHYTSVYQSIDYWIMLQAPSFDHVFNWRLEQEEKLRKNSRNTQQSIMSPEQLKYFIEHFQRLTEHALSVLPEKVDCLFRLDENRRII